MAETNIGNIVQIIGPVVDIRFKEEHLPNLLNAIKIKGKDGEEITVEVSQHVGDDIVRCISMDSTDGFVRGMEAVDTGAPISVPVGENTLGRMFNVTGDAIDGKENVSSGPRAAIHRQAPAFDEQQTSTEIFETGIKVVDLICPYSKGGKVGLFGGAGVG
ncbi:MAG: F0F1 ATP synthase subunit beta, partial [Senegalia sp. (in: firmicutes)]